MTRAVLTPPLPPAEARKARADTALDRIDALITQLDRLTRNLETTEPPRDDDAPRT